MDREGISYHVVDIEQHPEAAALVEQVNHGNQTVPTLVYADGTRADEPVADAGQGEAGRAGVVTLARRLTRSPGSGPPYQSSTSDRLIETPPGRTSVPGGGLRTHLPRG